MNGFLFDEVKVTRVKAAVAAGTTDQVSSIVDMQGFDGVMFVGCFGTSATNNGLTVQQSADSGMSGGADLAGSSVLLDATQLVAVQDIQRPAKRYLTATAKRGTSTTLDSILAIQYKARTLPVVNTVVGEKNLTPAEGTA
jgi:hypothetical protein